MRRLTVLGSCGAYPEPSRACSGFLLEWDGFRVVLDLGYGALPRLLAHCPDAAVDAVVVTHEHPDHCLDLHGLLRIWHYGRRPDQPVPCYAPPGVRALLAGIEPDTDLLAVVEPYELPGRYRLGPFELHGVALPHHVPNAGVRLETDGLVLAYTGDTGPDPALVELGKDADVYVVEATDRPDSGTREPERFLLTADDSGRYAAAAGARRLLLTHFWPGTDRAASVARAAEHFAGPVLAADEGLELPLSRCRRG